MPRRSLKSRLRSLATWCGLALLSLGIPWGSSPAVPPSAACAAEPPGQEQPPDEIADYVRQYWHMQSNSRGALSDTDRQAANPPYEVGQVPISGEGASVQTDGDSTNDTTPWAFWEDDGLGGPWTQQLLPNGIIYRNYLAGEKEPRLRSVWAYQAGQGWIWDITLGGRVGLFRYGTMGDGRPEGWQIDVEGAGFPRLDLEEERDLVSADFRAGVPITYGTERYQMKVAYYHLSSHLGDEFLLKHPGFPRLNYSRDVLVNGHSLQVAEAMRVYGEIGWAFVSDVSEPWELQFGVEYSPEWGTGSRGSPFAAVATHLREEVDFGGNLVVQAGWAWRAAPAGGLLRFGFHYFDGKSDQFSFFDRFERKVGLGLWYDF